MEKGEEYVRNTMKNALLVSASLVVAGLSFNATAFASTQPSTTTTQISDFTAPQQATPQEAQELESNAIVESGQKQSVSSNSMSLTTQSLPSPTYTTSPIWQYSNLTPNSYINSKNTYKISSTEQAYLNLVQWDSGHDSNTKVIYELINLSGGSNSSAVTVSGDHESSDAYVYFNNVTPGTYELRIFNPTVGETEAGNGYTHYY